MSIDPYLVDWAVAFSLTAVVELPVVVFVLGSSVPKVERRIAGGFFAQLASHPAVWFIFPLLPMSYLKTTLASETWAVLSEASLYSLLLPVPLRRALACSLVANVASFGVGLLLRMMGWF